MSIDMSIAAVDVQIPTSLQELLPAIVAELAWMEGGRTRETDPSWVAVAEAGEALGRMMEATVAFDNLHRGLHAMERNAVLAADVEYQATMDRHEVTVVAAVLRLRYLRRAMREGVRA